MKNNILQAEVPQDKIGLAIAFLRDKLIQIQYMKGNVLDLSGLKDYFSVEDIEYFIDNEIEVLNIPFYVELAPSRKTNITPSMFPDRAVASAWDEDGNVTATRNLKIGEYFRYHEKGGRFFIELVNDPKSDPNSPLSTISIMDYLSASQIKEVYTTFSTAILNKYASMKAMLDELETIEEVE